MVSLTALLLTFEDSSVVLCEVFEDAMFYDELHRRKNVTREEAGRYATIIQVIIFTQKKKKCLRILSLSLKYKLKS